MNKKLIIMAMLGIGILWSNGAYATTYYVRLDGGTARECSGTVNAPYSGSGTGQPCSFNHPRYALGWGCTNMGNSCANAGVMQRGDTLYIDGDDPTNGGAQAQYEVGYDDTNNGLTPGCSSSWPYDCTLGNLPGGINASQRTSIIGSGTHKPQLWGTQRVWQVLNADNNHIWLQNLEITDHEDCAYNSPDKACNYDGPSYGQWGEDGLSVGGDDVNVTDVYIHGLGRYGINTDNLGSAVFTRLNVIGNGFAGISTGINATIAGTLTFNQPIIEWNGCVESYPLNTTSPTDSPSNFSDCFGQNQNGYGDGLAFGNVGHGSAGNWVIYGPGSISFNTQDGFDTLHGNGNGTIQIDKMRFEGNAGNQVKMNALVSSLTNSVVIGDCGWWAGAPQSSSGFAGGDICRALGDAVLFNVTESSQTYLYNNTIVSNGNVALESEDLNGTGCNGSTAINAKNNIVFGGYSWIDDTAFNGSGGNSLTTYIYNDGNNGNGGGTCGPIVWNEDYNIVSGTKNGSQGCSGPHDKCGTNPGFISTIPMGSAGGGANTYYKGNAAETLVSLANNSPAIAAGVSGLNYWNNGNDYHNVNRTNPPSIGGLEKSSCAVNTYGCFFNSDCCTGTCSNFVCGGTVSTTDTTPASTPTSPTTTGQPVVAITAPASGNTFTVGSNVTITATASESNGTITNISILNGAGILLGSSSTSPYNYVDSNVLAGTYTFTAQATDANGVTVTSSPITITVIEVSLPTITLTSPANGSSLTAGSSVTITASASETNGTISQVEFFNGSTLLGTDTHSPYSFAWNNVPAGNYNLTAVATDANGATVTSNPVSITLTAPIVAAAPEIALSGPANGSNFTSGSNVTITASASETNGTISQVAFFNGSTLLGTATSSPYSFTWNNLAAGNYNLTAVATDATGATVTSNTISVTVTAPILPSAPEVSLTSPANGSSVTAGSNITMTASASETNGSISKVAFYNGSTLLGTDTSKPYNFTWNAVAAGNYNLTAVATDASGTTVTSNPISITVTAPVVPSAPVVSLTSPANGSSVTAGSNITITASASEANGTIAQVTFFNGSTLLGTDTNSPYTFTWNTPATGNYNLTAVATDANGVSATSNVVAVTVNAAPTSTDTTTATTNPPANASTINITSLTNNASYTVPANIPLTVNVSDTNGIVTRVDYYAGSIYVGESTNSPYTVNWTSAQAGTYSMTAKATDKTGAVFYSPSINITVNPHLAPTVSLTAPIENASYPAPGNIVLTANASAGGGTITKVDFYNGSLYLGTAYSSPFSINWNNVQPGNYSVSAKATDSYGWSITSSAVDVVVTAVVHTAPTVSMTTPSNSFTAPASITLNATASEANGTIAQVTFFNGSTLLGTDTNSPYTFTWNAVAAGNYNLTAVATDANGVSTTSSVVAVTVNAASTDTSTTTTNAPPSNDSTITMTSPDDGGAYTVPARIKLRSNVSDSNGTVTRVDYYAGSIYVGESTNGPSYAVNWTSAQAGTYSITAKATDTTGAIFYSPAINITVNPHTLPTISLTAPVENASYTAPGNIVLTANATVGGGTITKVDFYNGSLYLGTAYNSPYSINWNNVQAGNYSVTAKATDSYGWSITSSGVDVVVTNTNTPAAPVAPIAPPPPVNNSTTVTTPPVTNPAPAQSDTTTNTTDSSTPDSGDTSSGVLSSIGSSDTNASN